MGALSALQYGLSGLSALLFLTTVGILTLEIKQRQPRKEVLRALYVVMFFAAFMVLIPAALQFYDDEHDRQARDAKADTEALKDKIKEQIKALSRIEDLKGDSILGDSVKDAEAKKILLQDFDAVCGATEELKKTVGMPAENDVCTQVKQYLKPPQ